jgi:hypothetical protein
VQIAPYNYGGNPETEAEFWEAQQAAAQSIPNTGMAVINDIGDLKDIHPKNKQDVGHRLALLALAKTYGHDKLEYSGPVFKSLSIEDEKLRVNFDHAGGDWPAAMASRWIGSRLLTRTKAALSKPTRKSTVQRPAFRAGCQTSSGHALRLEHAGRAASDEQRRFARRRVPRGHRA